MICDLFAICSKCKGSTPFFQACYYGHLECGKELVKYKADYNCTCKVLDTSPLMAASESGNESIVRWLLSLPDIDVFHKNNINWNALYAACVAVNLNIVSYLYTYVMKQCLYDSKHPKFVEFVNQADVDGYTPIMAALIFDVSDRGSQKIVKFLVEKCKIKLDLKSNDGNTAADLAKEYGRDDIALYLSKR